MSQSREKKKRRQKQEFYNAVIPPGVKMENLGPQLLNGVKMLCTKVTITAGGMTAGFTSMVPAELEDEPNMVNIRTCVDVNAIRIVQSLLTGLAKPQGPPEKEGPRAIDELQKFLDNKGNGKGKKE